MVAAEPKHKLVERVVAAVQRVLLPDAQVQHNVLLPDLHLPGEPTEFCQCDVVIRSGKTLTIIEVQDRDAVVDVNTYRGWCLKREHVGANNLICVSTAGFPRSVRRDALLRGPMVRLVTLDEIESGSSIALFGSLPTLVTLSRLSASFGEIRLVSLDRDPAKTQMLQDFDAHAIVFENTKGLRASLREMLKPTVHVPELLFGPHAEYTHEFETNSRVGLRYLPHGEEWSPVDVAGTVTWRVQTRRVLVTVSEYKCLNDHGHVAWTMSAAEIFDGDRQIQIRVVFVPGEDGRLRSSIEIDGPQSDADLLLTLSENARVDVYNGALGQRVTTSGFAGPPDG